MLSYAESDVDLVFSFICFIVQIKLHDGFKSCCTFIMQAYCIKGTEERQ